MKAVQPTRSLTTVKLVQAAFRLLLLAAALLVGLAASSLVRAQDTAGSETSAADATAAEAPAAPENWPPAADAKFKVEVTDDAPPPTAMQRVDGVFKTAVDFFESVLFRRIFRSQQQFIQFAEEAQYVRPAGSQVPFRQLVDGQITEEDLTPGEVERYKALGKLALSSQKKAWKPGTLKGAEGEAGRAVDVITVKIKNDKYIFRDGLYRKLEPLQDRLSEEDTLTDEQATEAAAAGRLAMTEGDTPSHIKREWVGGAPIVVLWLSLGAVFFTVYMGFFNIRGFKHALDVTRGKYDNPNDPGEISHFQALSSALSATVGLGNIAGVTIAMVQGGPGAFFWMMLAGVLGMSSKFAECTLGQKYRIEKEDGTVLGGPMTYLHVGIRELGQRFGIGPAAGAFGLVLSITFAVMCILASFGGGNMFQANQSSQAMLAMLQLPKYLEMEALNENIRDAAEASNDAEVVALEVEKKKLQDGMDQFGTWFKPVFGVLLAVFVGAVIIGGIKRIGAAASKVVPAMCIIYILACIFIIGKHAAFHPYDLLNLMRLLVTEAFTPQAFGGGVLGILVIGVQRAAFSNEAGCGSAAIAHSAAKTKEPVREGCVAMLGPFIDTVVICSMTALVILITGAWNNEEWIIEQGRAGATLTSKAFASEISFFPYILSVAVLLFAYSTIISWSYYGEKCWERMFGARSVILYRIIYVGAVFLGAIVDLGAVLNFSDIMILTMAFPNILGVVLLSPVVRRDLLEYWRRYKAGEFKTYR